MAAAEADEGEFPGRELPALLVGHIDPPNRVLAREVERDLGVPVIDRVPVEELADPEVEGLDRRIIAGRSLGRPRSARALGLLVARGAPRRAASMPVRPGLPTRRVAPALATLVLRGRSRR